MLLSCYLAFKYNNNSLTQTLYMYRNILVTKLTNLQYLCCSGETPKALMITSFGEYRSASAVCASVDAN